MITTLTELAILIAFLACGHWLIGLCLAVLLAFDAGVRLTELLR